jgi:hypothetical protein
MRVYAGVRIDFAIFLYAYACACTLVCDLVAPSFCVHMHAPVCVVCVHFFAVKIIIGYSHFFFVIRVSRS